MTSEAFAGGAESTLRRLAAESDIRAVIARYARAVDRRDDGLIRACFHVDARAHYGVYDGDLDGFVTWVLNELSGYTQTMHFHGPSIIDWPGDGRVSSAVVETYALAIHHDDDGDRRRNWVGGLRYLDRFQFRSGESDEAPPSWRIAERTVVGDWLRLDPFELHRSFARPIPQSQAGSSDLIFQLLAHG